MQPVLLKFLSFYIQRQWNHSAILNVKTEKLMDIQNKFIQYFKVHASTKSNTNIKLYDSIKENESHKPKKIR